MPASASVAPAGTRAEPTAFEPENSRIADYSIDNTVEVEPEFVLFGFVVCARVFEPGPWRVHCIIRRACLGFPHSSNISVQWCGVVATRAGLRMRPYALEHGFVR